MDELISALAAIGDVQADCRRYNDYYDGKHKLTFATKKFDDAFGSLFNEFADNLCPVVVDSLADKLNLTGFADELGADAASAEGDTPSALAWDIWLRNRMDELAEQVHKDAAIDGSSFVIVWPDVNNEAVLYPNAADRVMVHYDDEDTRTIDWAAKVWTLDDLRVRATLYYPDRIEKYITSAKQPNGLPTKADAFEEFHVEGEAWPLPNPYNRVPVFHFANNARRGKRGKSELADVIAIQDGLNKSVADMLVAGEYMAMPQRWATGLEVPVDPATGKPYVDPATGKPQVPFYYGVDRVWTVGDKEVRFGQFDSANLTQFLEEQEKFRMEIARISRTPLHYIVPISGQFPSGEALKTATEPFLDKVVRRQVSFGNVWEDVMGFALLVEHGITGSLLQAQWADIAPRNELAHIQTITAKAALKGVSPQQLLREAGYSDAEIADMAEEIAEAQTGLPLRDIKTQIDTHLADLQAAASATTEVTDG